MALTLRLEKEELEQLDKIQKDLGLSTYSKTIRHIISNFSFMSDQIRGRGNENRELSRKLYEIKRLTDERNNADLQLTEVLKQLN